MTEKRIDVVQPLDVALSVDSRQKMTAAMSSSALQVRNAGLVVRRLAAITFLTEISAGANWAPQPAGKLGLGLNTAGPASGIFLYPLDLAVGTQLRQLSLRASLKDQLDPAGTFVSGEVVSIDENGVPAVLATVHTTSTANTPTTDSIPLNITIDSTLMYVLHIGISQNTGYGTQDAAAYWLELQYTTARFSGQ